MMSAGIIRYAGGWPLRLVVPPSTEVATLLLAGRTNLQTALDGILAQSRQCGP